jgi:uncharacterized protein (TIGR03435 family)
MLLAMVVAPACAQTAVPDWQAAAGGKMQFDVASVKQNKTDEQSSSNFSLDSGYVYSTVNKGDTFAPNGGYFSARNLPLFRYILFAYKLSGTQDLAMRASYSLGDLGGRGFFGGLSANVPAWVKEDRFDIEARAEGTPSKDQMRLMMQSLLAERFKLAIHMERRQVPVFAMVLVDPGKTGPHLQPHPADDSCTTPHPAATGGLPETCGVIAHLAPSAPGRWRFGGRNVTLAVLASSLPIQTGMATVTRPVIDRTGLSGGFDFSLEWAPDTADAASAEDVSGSSFRKALKEQFGIKLVPEKGTVDVPVIDHVEMPTAN